MKTFQGFKNFLMQGNVIVAAIGLSIALAFSTLVKAVTDNIVTPLVNAAGSPGVTGLGVHVHGQLIDFGECQSDDLPVKAIRCKYCATDLRAASAGPVA